MGGGVITGRIGQWQVPRPARGTLEYLKLGLEVLLLLLAVPLVLFHIHNNPRKAAEHAWTRG